VKDTRHRPWRLATPLVLTDASYRRQFGKPNPDTALLAQLHRAGVEIFVCGQALNHQNHAVADVRDDVRVSLSDDQAGRPARGRLRPYSLTPTLQARVTDAVDTRCAVGVAILADAAG